jgi:hypothetical protein
MSERPIQCASASTSRFGGFGRGLEGLPAQLTSHVGFAVVPLNFWPSSPLWISVRGRLGVQRGSIHVQVETTRNLLNGRDHLVTLFPDRSGTTEASGVSEPTTSEVRVTSISDALGPTTQRHEPFVDPLGEPAASLRHDDKGSPSRPCRCSADLAPLGSHSRFPNLSHHAPDPSQRFAKSDGSDVRARGLERKE